MRKQYCVAMTIAGLDPDGGAGIVADIKTFTALGVYATVALTGIAVQNTYEPGRVYEVPAIAVEEQIDFVARDMGIDAAKTGMLYSSEIVEVVAKCAKRYGFKLVIDPVIKGKVGINLLKPQGLKILIEGLIPLATIVTPNIREAELITGIKINDIKDMERAAKYIVDVLGAKAAVIKGGHAPFKEAIDILYIDGEFKEFKAPRIINGCWHGAGCSFSAAATAFLALGKSIVESIKLAKKFTMHAARYGFKGLGRGACPISPESWIEMDAERYKVLDNIRKAIELLESSGELLAPLIPEVQMNLVMALPKRYVHDLNDVAGVLGRIIKYGNKVKAAGPPTFGASKHLARAVLKAMEYNSQIRSAINIKYDPKIIEIAKSLGLKISSYDRRKEPPHVKRIEGGSIPWGIEEAIRRLKGQVPDIVYHLGDWGKEPMINVFGISALDVARKVIEIAKEYSKILKEPS